MRHILALLAFLALPLTSAAGQYPGYENTLLNDYAELLSPAQERVLRAEIQALRDETGVELTLLTLPGRAPYGAIGSFEAFATGLFNHWGIGDACRNDGILILVLRDERKIRIELGAGYGPGFDNAAARIIRTAFVPAFMRGDYPAGILTGTQAVMRDIARHAVGGQMRPDNPNLATGNCNLMS